MNSLADFLKENYKGEWTISEEPNEDGLYVVNSNDNVSFHSFFELIKEWLSERENVPQKQTDRREP